MDTLIVVIIIVLVLCSSSMLLNSQPRLTNEQFLAPYYGYKPCDYSVDYFPYKYRPYRDYYFDNNKMQRH
jgi:hypothetical protein